MTEGSGHLSLEHMNLVLMAPVPPHGWRTPPAGGGVVSRGAEVGTCGQHSSEALESLSRELKGIGGEHRVLVADVAHDDDVERLIAECRDTLGGLDILV